MLLLPIFLCIVLFCPYSTSFDENADFVDAAVKALKTASAESDDVLLALSSLGSQAALLMKALIPIGSIVMETLPNPKPQSDEYEALMDFQNRTEEIWRDIKERIEISARGTRAKMARTWFYEKNVYLPIMDMKSLTDKFINMYKSDTFIGVYKTECKFHENAPGPILRRLNFLLVSTCGDAITPTYAQELADLRAYLMRVFLRFRVEHELLPDPGLYLSEFLAIYEKGRIGKGIFKEDLDVFKRSFSSYREAVEALFEELQDRASIEKVGNYEDNCLLRGLIHTSYFNYPTVKAFVLELRNQLIDVAYIAGICASVTQHGNAKSIEIFIKEIVDDVTRISSYTSKWLNDSLISAWPSAHNEILREQIMRIMPKPGDVGNRNLNKVAALTHPLLINTGLPNHDYGMLIVRAVEEDYRFYYEGIDNFCSFNEGVFGFDTVINRIFVDSTNEKETFNVGQNMIRLYDDAVLNFNITIQHEMPELFNEASLPLIAYKLKAKIGKQFITQRDFHCWAIAREWSPKIWNSCPTIDYRSSFYNWGDLSSITTLNYTNRGGVFHHCEEFRFLFFA